MTTAVDPRVIADALGMDTLDLARVLTKWAGEALPIVEFDSKWKPTDLDYFDSRVEQARAQLISAHEAYKAWEQDNPEDDEA